MLNANRFLKLCEFFLLFCVLALQIHLLGSQFGLQQGHDVSRFFEVIDHVSPGKPLPGTRECFNCFHPPFSFFSVKILSLLVGNVPLSSQIFSWVSMLFAFLLLRASLKRMGVLSSLEGIVFLYLSSALPIFIFLSTASDYEPATYFFTMLSLYFSTALYWNSAGEKLSARRLILLCALLLSFTGGLLNKYTGLLSFAIPFCIVLVRNPEVLWKTMKEQLVVFLIVALLVSPLYISRNFAQEGDLFPMNMSWLTRIELAKQRSIRNEDVIGFFTHTMRIPREFFSERTSPIQDSVVHRIWLQTWIREKYIGGPQSPLSDLISTFYYFFFLVPVTVGSLLFVLRSRRQADAFHSFGTVLLSLSCIFFLAMLIFIFKYPVWNWGVIKAKYIAPALLWMPFATAYCIHCALLTQKLSHYRPLIFYGSLGLLLLFVVLNYTVPVY